MFPATDRKLVEVLFDPTEPQAGMRFNGKNGFEKKGRAFGVELVWIYRSYRVDAHSDGVDSMSLFCVLLHDLEYIKVACC
jgi:hypothetical protein